MIKNQIIIIGTCAILVILIMITNLFVTSKKSIFDKTKIFMFLAIVFISIPFAFINVYAVNCMIEGNCDIFVWILVTLSVIFTIIYILIFIYKLIKLKTIYTDQTLSKK